MLVFKPFATALGLAACIAVAAAAPAHAGSFHLYSPPGDNVVVNTGPPSDPNVLQVTSKDSGPTDFSGYGGMYYDARGDNLTVSNVTTLSALYQMTQGTFAAGAPRFSLIDTTSNAANEAYVYWGTSGSFTDPHPGSFASTGNLADITSSDLRVQVNGFNGDSTGNGYETWAQFVAKDGGATIAYITLDLDAGYSQPSSNYTQQMITDEFTVNNNVYEAGPDPTAAPEPASFTLLSLGLAALAGYRRRQQLLRMVRGASVSGK